ncbi:MAG: hypothetical protein U0457_20125 [Candidatus Sericytochromatia bacterium]
MIKKIVLNFIIYSLTIILISCTQNVKKEDNEEKFDKQISELSLDELLVGDDLNYWGADSPRGSIFLFTKEATKLKLIGLKPTRFKELDKTDSELAKQIQTSPLYQLEIYELPKPDKLTPKHPQICDYISDNFQKANLLKIIAKLELRLKERNWIPINVNIKKNTLVFVRIGVGELYSTIQNKSTDAFWMLAKNSNKNWDEMMTSEKNKIISWSCQEYTFMDNHIIQPAYYNPDIIFNYE